MSVALRIRSVERTAHGPREQALALLDCYAAISEDGLSAIASGTSEAVEDALAARSDIIAALEMPFSQIREAAASGDDDALAVAVMLQARLHDLEGIESRLRIALGASLHAIDSELRAQGSEGRRYEAPAPPPYLDRIG